MFIVNFILFWYTISIILSQTCYWLRPQAPSYLYLLQIADRVFVIVWALNLFYNAMFLLILPVLNHLRENHLNIRWFIELRKFSFSIGYQNTSKSNQEGDCRNESVNAAWEPMQDTHVKLSHPS